MEVQQDFRDLLELFNAHRVEYMLVGAYALAFHGVPPVRVDIITSITGVSWDEALSGRVGGEYGNIPAYYIGRRQFAANKKALGRKKDLADLEALAEI